MLMCLQSSVHTREHVVLSPAGHESPVSPRTRHGQGLKAFALKVTVASGLSGPPASPRPCRDSAACEELRELKWFRRKGMYELPVAKF